jgi:hypothetical protein
MTNAQLEDYSVPEMRRVPLEDVCLQVISCLVLVDTLTGFLCPSVCFLA